MTISAQENNLDPSKMQTLQFIFSGFDADRRWSFSIPAVGQVIYLEKSGLKYLLLADRKQYIELLPGDAATQLAKEFTPSKLARKVISVSHPEMLGVEPVNGRTARKYRFKAEDSQIDGTVYVDIETGLAVRIEMNSKKPPSGMRVIVELRDIQLNPDRALFDVPIGNRKTSSQEARQQIDTFSSTLRSFVSMMSGSAPSAPPANRNAPARQ